MQVAKILSRAVDWVFDLKGTATVFDTAAFTVININCCRKGCLKYCNTC